MTKHTTQPYSKLIAQQWLLKLLRKLPSTQQGFFKLATALYILALFYLLAVLIIDHINLVHMITAMLTPTALLIATATGSWFRKRIDIGTSRADRRKKLLHRLVKTVIKATPNKTGEYLLKRFVPSTTAPYVFPTPQNERLIAEIENLNCDVVLGTGHIDNTEVLAQSRHGAYQQKNRLSLMLISQQIKASSVLNFIAYTHLMPVNKTTYEQYMTGELLDSDLSADFVCRPDEPAFAILLLSIGLDRYRLKQLFKNRTQGQFDRFLARLGLPPFSTNDLYQAEYDLWVGVIHHLRQLLQHQTTMQAATRIVAHPFNGKIEQLLLAAGFNKPNTAKTNGKKLCELTLTLIEDIEKSA